MEKSNYWWNINHIFYKIYPLTIIDIFGTIALSFGLYLVSLYSYVLFHTTIEFYCIMIAFTIFIVIWNSREYLDEHVFLFLGIALFFISFIDITHTLAYPGINLFAKFDSTTNLTTQLWIAARYIEAFTILMVPFLFNKKIKVRLTFEIYSVIILVTFASIFTFKIFPTSYIDGLGLTLFKKISEYTISIILTVAAVLLYKKKNYLDKNIFYLLFTSIIFTILSELSLTTYFNVSDFSNILGHYFKLISYLLIYKTISEIGIKHPLSYIFNSMTKDAEKVKISETKFRSLVEIATDSIILTNGIDEIELWNKSSEIIFGWKEKDIMGKTLDLIIPKKKIGNQNFDIKQKNITNNEGFNTTVESSGVRKNGEIFPLEFSFSSWKANDELFYCYIIRDISDRKKIEKDLFHKNEKLEKIITDLKIVQSGIDYAFAHVIITDENGVILYVNKSAEEMTGFHKEEMLGRKPSLWGKQMKPSFYENLWNTIKKDKQKFSGRVTNKKKNGEIYEAEVRISPILDDHGDVKFFIALERDITSEIETDRAKSEFISIAAHQLRTPLSTISIISEMLLRDIVGSTSKENKKYLKSIFKEIRSMTVMIETFLDVSRIELEKFPTIIETVSLYEVVEDILQELLPQLKNKKIHFKKTYSKHLPVLNIDRNAIQIVLGNIVSNAIKYTPIKGKITLSINENQSHVTMEVSDNGIGIPDKDKSKIFTKMFRAENTTQIKSDGSGLGLYLVKNVAEQNGYTVTFESKENNGTTFFISIPKKALDKSAKVSLTN